MSRVFFCVSVCSLLLACQGGSPSTDRTNPPQDMGQVVDGFVPKDMKSQDAFVPSLDISMPADLASVDLSPGTDGATAMPDMSGTPDMPAVQDPLEVELSVSQGPLDGDFIPRDKGQRVGSVEVVGTLQNLKAPQQIHVHVVQDDQVDPAAASLCTTLTASEKWVWPKEGATAPEEFKLSVQVPVGSPAAPHALVVCLGQDPAPRAIFRDLIVGDVLIVTGQSNAVARQHSRSSSAETDNASPMIRTLLRDGRWYQATADRPVNRKGAMDQPLDAHAPQTKEEADQGIRRAHIGQWPIRMAKRLLEDTGVPVGVINGGYGGLPVSFLLPDEENPANPETNYGALYERQEARGLRDKVRALLWYQGESDLTTPRQTYKARFAQVRGGWARDYPGLESLYVIQVRQGCAPGSESSIQETLRQIAQDDPQIELITTTGIDGHDGCHFFFETGYRILGERIANLLALRLWGVAPSKPALHPASPVLKGARVTPGRGAVVIDFELGDPTQSLTTKGPNLAHFGVKTKAGKPLLVSRIWVDPKEPQSLVLSLVGAAPNEPLEVTYTGHVQAGDWVTVASTGVGIPTFESFDVSVR